MLLTPTYHVLEMYTVHHDAHLIPVEFDSPDYSLKGKNLPALSISASRGKDGKLNISMVNIDSQKNHKVTVGLKEFNISNFESRILTSKKLQDYNTFENSENVKPVTFTDYQLNGENIEVNLPPFSVVVLTEK
jgi:alpha-N-arabinofuranosidase